MHNRIPKFGSRPRSLLNAIARIVEPNHMLSSKHLHRFAWPVTWHCRAALECHVILSPVPMESSRDAYSRLSLAGILHVGIACSVTRSRGMLLADRVYEYVGGELGHQKTFYNFVVGHFLHSNLMAF